MSKKGLLPWATWQTRMSMPQPRRETWHLIWSQTWKKNQMKKSNMEIVIIITLMSQLRLLSLNPNQTMSTKSGKEGWTLKSNNDSFKLSKLPSNIIEIWQQCSVYTWAYVSKSGLYLKFYHQYEFVFLDLNTKETGMNFGCYLPRLLDDEYWYRCWDCRILMQLKYS